MVPADDRPGRDAGRPGRLRRLGFVYMPMGCDITRWTPPGRGHARRAVADPQPAGAGEGARHGDHATWSCRTPTPARTRPPTPPSSAPPGRSTPRAPTTTSARPSTRSPPSRSARRRSCRRSSWRWTCSQIVGQCDNGYACVYQNNLSWSSPTTPLPAEAHPRIVFERLFGEGGSKADRQAALQTPGQPARLRQRRDRPPRQDSSARPTAPGSASTWRPSARSSAASRRPRRDVEGQPAAGPRPPRRRARLLRRPRPADVRPPGAGAAGRRHPRHHLPARPRDQQPHLPRDRRPRPAPPADAPRQRPGQDRPDGQDQRVPRLAVRRVPRAS